MAFSSTCPRAVQPAENWSASPNTGARTSTARRERATGSPQPRRPGAARVDRPHPLARPGARRSGTRPTAACVPTACPVASSSRTPPSRCRSTPLWARNCACCAGQWRMRLPTTSPNALRNWEALAPEERWWLYTMTVATTGQALQKGIGWRKALRAALADNPFVKGEGMSPRARRELLGHSQLSLNL
jgi:hypothetical protein